MIAKPIVKLFDKPILRSGWIQVAVAGLAAASLWASPVWGQSGLTRDEVLRLPPPLQAAAADYGAVRCAATPLAASLPGELPIGSLDALAFDGVTVLPFTELYQLAFPQTRQPVTREGLGRLATALECRYRELGYVFARVVVVPDPSGEPNRYRVKVTEGIVQRVEALAANEALANLALRAFTPVREGQPLQAADVRRGLAQAASAGLTDVRPTIRRSRLDPAAVDLVLVVGGTPDQFIFSGQNGNSEALGPYGVLAGLRVGGLTPLAERSSVGVYAATESREQWSVQLESEALLSGQGLRARWGGAYSRAHPGAVLAPLEVDAKTLYLLAELSRPVAVRRGLLVAARGGLEAVDQRTLFLGGLPLGNDRSRVGYLGLRADGLMDDGVWSADLQVRRGLAALGASRAGSSELSRADAEPAATALRLDADFGRQLTRSLTLRGTLRAQWSDRPLLAFERISFGGLNGGPGFDPGAMVGDSGVAATLQLFLPSLALGTASLRPFVQVAGARLESTGEQAENASGAAVAAGVQGSLGRSWQVQAMWAEPVGGIVGVSPDAYRGRFLLSITGAFDWRREPVGGEFR